MSDTTKLFVHLNEDGSVEISPHPCVGGPIFARLPDPVFLNWRHAGGDADKAHWISGEYADHQEDRPERPDTPGAVAELQGDFDDE